MKTTLTNNEMVKFFYETDGGDSGYINAKNIDTAREIFFGEHPDIDPQCAGLWSPDDSEYPDDIGDRP